MPKLYRPITSSLRSRLLVLTIIFSLIVEVFIYVPGIATYRQSYLEERLVAAQIASLSLEEVPGGALSMELEADLLSAAGVIAIVMRREDKSLLLGFDVMPHEVDTVIDMRSPALGMLIMEAWETWQAGGNRVIRVIGRPVVAGTRYVEITMAEQGLYSAMVTFSNNILILSLIISIFTGVLVYLALHWLLVRPMRRIRKRIVSFIHNPDHKVPSAKSASGRRDEIGVVERELVRMQQELQASLKEKQKLAELGEAVAKINHDLRGILATAQLSSEVLSKKSDPKLAGTSRRLMTSISKAVALCERTMRHGRSAEPTPEPMWVPLKAAFTEVGEALGLYDNADFTFTVDIGDEITAYIDPDQMHRVFLNICRNGVEAQAGKGRIEVTAEKDTQGTVHITICDAGPGIPEAHMPNLFKPFMSSNKAGGTGLGLAVARDIVLAHGGQIGLKDSSCDGAAFGICLPGENGRLENGRLENSDHN